VSWPHHKYISKYVVLLRCGAALEARLRPTNYATQEPYPRARTLFLQHQSSNLLTNPLIHQRLHDSTTRAWRGLIFMHVSKILPGPYFCIYRHTVARKFPGRVKANGHTVTRKLSSRVDARDEAGVPYPRG
jgi:hypothetical protein